MLKIEKLVSNKNSEQVLAGLSLSVENKGIHGILGASEAQRHALANIICGCMDADSGEVTLDGQTVSRATFALKKKIRLVPTCLLCDGMSTPMEYLDFVGQSLGVESEKRYRQMKEALELVGIDNVQNKIVSRLGIGERCRLAIAGALIGNPEVIVLDDPFDPLDNSTKIEVYEILEMLANIKTVILISHTPSEVKRLCSEVAIMSGGRIALEGKISEIEEKINATKELYITVRGEEDNALSAIRSLDTVVDAKITGTEKNGVHSIRIEHCPDDKIKDKLFNALKCAGGIMLSFRVVTLTLDDVYFSLTSRDTEKNEYDSNDGNEDEISEMLKAKKKGLGRRKNK